MDVIQQFINRARKVNKRIVFPEGSDERIQKAARWLLDDGIVQPILIGEANKLKKQADISGISLDGIGIVCHETAPCLNDYAAAYNTARIGVSKRGCVAGVANTTEVSSKRQVSRSDLLKESLECPVASSW